MSRKPETVFRDRVTRDLRAMPDCWSESIQQQTIHGTPDKIGVVNGLMFGLELKARPDAAPSPLQFHKLQRINQCGGYGALVHPGNWERVRGELSKLAHIYSVLRHNDAVREIVESLVFKAS